MLVATAACAVVAAIGASLEGPLLFRAAMLVYFMFLALYGVLALARGLGAYRAARAYRRQLHAECEDLSKRARRGEPHDEP